MKESKNFQFGACYLELLSMKGNLLEFFGLFGSLGWGASLVFGTWFQLEPRQDQQRSHRNSNNPDNPWFHRETPIAARILSCNCSRQTSASEYPASTTAFGMK